MTTHSVIVLLVLAGMIVVLAKDVMRPGLVLFSAVVLLMLVGVITPKEAIAGFSNKGMITVAVLFLVSEGVRQSGALSTLISRVLPMTKIPIARIQMRLLPAVAAISAFLNNTAVVIIFGPIIKKWSESINLPSTKFLIPLSYATIFGGVCSLIGTSTNLVVHGMMLDAGFAGFSMFELGKVGLVITFVGIIYIILFGNMLLPGERGKRGKREEPVKEYLYNVMIPHGSRLAGSVVTSLSVDRIPQTEVCTIIRDGLEIHSPEGEVLREGDTLILAGKSQALGNLLANEGVELSCMLNADPEFVRRATKQIEAVIGPRFPGIGKSLGEFDFYRHYGAEVMSVHRNGERISEMLGSLVLKEGDNLVLLADDSFMSAWGESRIFYTVNERGDYTPRSGKKTRWFALGLLIFMITGATLGDYADDISQSLTGYPLDHFFPALKNGTLDMFFFAAIVMVIMAWTKLFPARKYTKFVSWDILIAVASAFAISKGMINSGFADMIAAKVISLSSSWGTYAVLAAMFLITNIFTEIVTNNAAAALTFPISLAISEQMGVSPMPFFVVICIAASSSFSTPIGYQTNLIVQSLGNYKFRDYMRIGLPLNILTFIITVLLVPLFWKF